MNDIKIVKYDHSYASEVADMWNRSGENWGGDDAVHSAEDIINQNDNMGNICAFLALDGKEVVGYCSFGEYKQDEGASYIPLLNVRPDYLGKKIGKQLLLKCVKMAIGAKWPRLDLYTWQGNDKAVPLYKKCGFFWERRDDTTHLMNFIPYAMRTEAVKQYFEELDWYKDSLREIKVESDGRTEGDFDYYDYIWKKEDLNLRMEFERRGRGLTCIETDDYMIRARINKQNLVFGRKYEIQYEIKNKTKKELNIVIKGQDDKNIRFDLEYEGNIDESQIVIGEFFVERVEEDQSIWRTHPCVASQININGKPSLFKVGINPKSPVKLTMSNLEPVFTGRKLKSFINIENNFDEEIAIDFRVPDTKFVSFDTPLLSCDLKAKEKVSKALSCLCTGHGFYDKDVVVNIRTVNEEMEFKTKIKGPFQGYSGKFHGQDDEGWYIYNGQYFMQLRKNDNVVSIHRIKRDNENISIRPPQLGKPFSLEFFNKKPDSVKFDVDEESVKIRAIYISKNFKDIQVEYIIELFQEGISKVHYEVRNNSKAFTHKDVYVNQNVFYLIVEGYIPYDGQIIKTPGADGLIANRWDFKKLDQNWVFCGESVSRGLGWPKDSKMTFDQVFFSIENYLGNIEPSEAVRSQPIVASLNTFDNWQDFARLMGNEVEQYDTKKVKQSLECSINMGNPFISDQLSVSFKEYKKKYVQGSVTIESQKGCCKPISKSLNIESDKGCLVDLELINKSEMDILDVQVNLPSKSIKRKKTVFFKGSDQISLGNHLEQGKEVFEADNGLIKIKASPQYSIGIFSVEHDGIQWLDNSFPNPTIKGWWNYWTGGISYRPTGITYASIQNELRKAEFVKIKDNHGNSWTGIKTTLDIVKNKKYKGMEVEQYFLMLPNVPVLCNMSVVKQNTGKYLPATLFKDELFIKAGNKLEDNWVLYIGDDGEEIRYRCVETEFDVSTNKNFMIHGVCDSKYKMIRLINKSQSLSFFNSNGTAWGEQTNKISAPDRSIIKINPSFITFSEERLDNVLLKDLTQLYFDLEL